MKRFVLPLLLPLALAACGKPPVEQISDARVELPAVPGRPGAAYMTFHGGERPNLVTEINSPRVMRVELHESVETDGKMRMGKIEGGVDVPAGGEVVMAPDGIHAMLFDISPSVKVGGKLPFKVTYADGRVIDVEAEVARAGDGAGHHH